MSDAHLRELERRWKGTGSPGDEALYLRERLRVGDLDRSQALLAAYCGHEPAVSVVGAPPRPDTDRRRIPGIPEWRYALDGWLLGLETSWPTALARVPLLPAWRALDMLGAGPRVQLARVALASFEAWVVTGSGQDAIERALDALLRCPPSWEASGGGDRDLTPAEQQEFHAIDSVRKLHMSSRDHIKRSLDHAQYALLPETLRQDQVRDDARSVLRLACQELVPWSLGYADPARDRILKRGEKA